MLGQDVRLIESLRKNTNSNVASSMLVSKEKTEINQNKVHAPNSVAAVKNITQPKYKYDLEQIKSELRNRTLELAMELLPNGKQNDKYWETGDLDDTPGLTLKVVLAGEYAGWWKDYNTGESGDIINLWMRRKNVKFKEAVKQLAGRAGVAPSYYKTSKAKKEPHGYATATEYLASLPAITKQPSPECYITEVGKYLPVSKCYDYANGRLQSCRFEYVDKEGTAKKTYRYRHWDGKDWNWSWKFLGKLPLFNGEQILNAKSNGQENLVVVFTEGEKCANEAKKIFPVYVVTTTIGGAQNPKNSDFSPLKDTLVVIWRDNDGAGKVYQNSVASLAFKAGAKEVFFINLDMLKLYHPKKVPALPEGWDAFDAIEEGFTADLMEKLEAIPDFFIKQIPETEENKKEKQDFNYSSSNQKLPRNFCYDDDNLIYKHTRQTNKNKTSETAATYETIEVRLCSCLDIFAEYRDKDADIWGYYIKYRDKDDKEHTWCMPAELVENQKELIETLRKRGVKIFTSLDQDHEGITDEWINKLVRLFIASSNPARRVRTVTKMGIHSINGKVVFVLPEQIITSNGVKNYSDAEDDFEDCEEGIVFQQSSLKTSHNIRQNGTAKEWKEKIGNFCSGNGRSVFTCCSGFAQPLAGLLDEALCGVHFYGESSTGKTTLLRVQASIYGEPNFIRQWRTTANAVEGIALCRNNLPLIMDDIGQVNPKEVGDTIYTIANGQIKARLSKDGSVKKIETFSTSLQSTGEVSIETCMGEVSKKIKAGQIIRLINIPACATKDYKVFENIHNVKDSCVC
jgi:hypothetical protein